MQIGSRALDILTQLVQRPGEVIDKLELIALVWAGTFVDESNLKVNIAAIQKVIDHDASNGSCIATVVGRGYRFVEPVRELSFQGFDRPPREYCVSGWHEPLIRRDRIVSQLTEHLSMHQLVTIVRMPDRGKTAIATVVAGTSSGDADRGSGSPL